MDTMTATRVDTTGEGWTIREAARACGVSEKTIRRRIKSGTLSAYQVTTQYGVEWRVTSLDTIGEGTPTLEVRTRHVQGRRIYSGRIERVEARQSRVDMSRAGMDSRPTQALELAEKCRQDSERLQQQNMELAGRCGYLQARLEASERQVLALTAPQEPGRTNAPWWRRLLGMEAA